MTINEELFTVNNLYKEVGQLLTCYSDKKAALQKLTKLRTIIDLATILMTDLEN